MLMPKTSVSAGTMMIPPPIPSSEPSTPAPTEMVNTTSVNSSGVICSPLREERGTTQASFCFSGETDALPRRIGRRLHQLSDCVKDHFELRIVFAYKRFELSGQI